MYDLLQNDAYKYPDIYVCTYDFYGCDDEDLLENCTHSAQSTEGGNSTAVFNPFGDDRQELDVGVLHTGQVIPACFFSIFVSGGQRLSTWRPAKLTGDLPTLLNQFY